MGPRGCAKGEKAQEAGSKIHRVVRKWGKEVRRTIDRSPKSQASNLIRMPGWRLPPLELRLAGGLGGLGRLFPWGRRLTGGGACRRSRGRLGAVGPLQGVERPANREGEQEEQGGLHGGGGGDGGGHKIPQAGPGGAG